MMLHSVMHNPLLRALRSSTSADVGLLVLRVVVGAIFVYHGSFKLFGIDETVMLFSKIGIPASSFFGPFVAGVEFVGGALLILGVASRLVSLAFIIDMTVAVAAGFRTAPTWMAHELEALLLASAFLVLLAGPGRASFDAWLLKRSQKAHDASLPMRRKA